MIANPGRLGKDRAFVVTLLVGIAVLFIGFLIASASSAIRPGAQPEVLPVPPVVAST